MPLKVKLEKRVLNGWTVYHLSLVGVFAAALLFAGINALIMRSSGGYEISAQATLPYAADTLWQWTIENDKRSKWQVGIYDLSRLHGEPEELDSTRMLFFRSGEEKWTGVELTLEATAPSKWISQQETFTSLHIYNVSLEALGPCKTRVTLHEITELYDFTERFWLFWNRGEHVERLEYSLRQLKTWMGHKGEVCEIG